MIYLTGDTHGHFERFGNKKFSYSTLTKNDFLVILGDFGGIWNGSKSDKYWLDWLNDKKFTTLFVDGNHENFDLLETYPVVSFRGGKAHRIRESVFHLMRGEIYDIDNKKIFVLGGAVSIDARFRIAGKSWWEQEIPSRCEIANAMKNLKKHNNEVDLILTHCVDLDTEKELIGNVKSDWYANYFESDYLEKLREFQKFLSVINDEVSYKQWYFGHYHQNYKVDEKKTALYNEVVKIE